MRKQEGTLRSCAPPCNHTYGAHLGRMWCVGRTNVYFGRRGFGSLAGTVAHEGFLIDEFLTLRLLTKTIIARLLPCCLLHGAGRWGVLCGRRVSSCVYCGTFTYKRRGRLRCSSLGPDTGCLFSNLTPHALTRWGTSRAAE